MIQWLSSMLKGWSIKLHVCGQVCFKCGLVHFKYATSMLQVCIKQASNMLQGWSSRLQVVAKYPSSILEVCFKSHLCIFKFVWNCKLVKKKATEK